MKYILSFINQNEPSEEYPDMEFESLIALEKHVQEKHSNFTSYGIVVIKYQPLVQS